MVKLKKGQETFTIVDGRDAGKTFEKGVEYDKPPKGYESRFARDLQVKKVKLHKPAVVKTIGRKESK
jgi:hypothetical protein